MIALSIALALALPTENKDASILVDTPALAHAYEANGYTEVENIFEQGDDLHHFALRPSMARKLAGANYLIYSGASIIPKLAEAATSNNSKIQTIALDTSEQNFDPHYWTSPLLMKPFIADDADAFDQIDQDLKQLKFPYKIILNHAAYDPFIEAYGITSLGSLTNDHDHEIGTRSHEDIESQIDENTCYIASSSEPNPAFEEIVTSKGAKVVRHDVLGWDIEGEGIEFFRNYYAKLGRVFSECAD